MKVFISGTSADLAPFRKVADNVLREMQADTVEQTHFGVDYASLPRLLEDKIRDCDAVICLIGSVFGVGPHGEDRSYTQMEHEFARELQKPTFIFLFKPPADWKIDPALDSDTPAQREFQQKYIAALKLTANIRYEFSSEDDLGKKVLAAFVKISPEAIAALGERTIRTDFPTPIAVLFAEHFRKDNSRGLQTLVLQVLRFITLLALHDSMVNRAFGVHSADRKARLQALATDERVSIRDWRLLLRLACANEVNSDQNHFVRELAGWEHRNSDLLERVIRLEAALWDLYIPPENAIINLRQALRSLFGELGFLKHYVLLVVSQVLAEGSVYRATMLKGLESRTFEFTASGDSPLRAEAHHVYLLNVIRRRALRLGPVMTCPHPGSRDEPQIGEGRVYAWSTLQPEPRSNKEEPSRFLTRPMPFDVPTGLETVESPEMVCEWLGDELCREVFGYTTATAAAIVWEGSLLSKDSWNKIHELVFPAGEVTILGGRFKCKNNAPLYPGLHANLFEVRDTTSEEVRLAHILRPDSAADEEIRRYFSERAKCWRELAHERVLPLDESGDPEGKHDPTPFLITHCIPRCRSIEQMLQSGELVPESLIRQAIDVAGKVCRVAHQKGICLLSLSPRHFLMDESGHLSVTGFEAASKGIPGEELPPSLLDRLRRFTKDVDVIAPEVRREGGVFGPPLDVFALGHLVAQLRRMPAHAADALPLRHWDDPWQCFVYHCLAADPNVRFRSVEHALEFVPEGPQSGPQTIAVESPNAKTFLMGKHPVTNAEFNRFTEDRNWEPPPYLQPRAQESADPNVLRLSGPWLPVTCVSLKDAEAFCHWLSTFTHKQWRLPTEDEWIRAAAAPTNGPYPWGDHDPNPALANYGGHYRGPTVIGAFPVERSQSTCRDMGGNVWEWCTDMVRSGAPRRIVKGGAYDYSSDSLFLLSKDARLVACRSPHVGFRVMCEEIQ